MHSPQDRIVEVENARIIYDSAKHPKSFISLDGADHLLTKKKDSIYAGKVIAAWAERYLDLEEKESLTEPERQVVVRTGDDGFTTEIRAGKHSFLADEPESVGGKDLGPTPYDLLAASLGTCTSMTLRMYADRKKWPLQQVIVHLEHKKVHESDCENEDDPKARIDQLSRELELIGPLTAEQKERLVEISEKCPVHKTLTGDIRVVTSVYGETTK
jgi:putative redox protein